ncbi:MAG TPA: tRNA (cytidine(34)-2'-O)-methyltransferase [Phycisphaerae bacterium]|nr:tRNA (cytidine(34)-2'-O)-methyltransferase [Phycisphaerae bacterium]
MLPPHHLKLVLVEPEIPQNTGNIARLCAATGAALHLVRPLGFFLTDKHFRRAGMDYLAAVPITVHDSLPDLLALIHDDPVVLSSGLAGQPHWKLSFPAHAWIFLGKESAGLPHSLLERFPSRTACIPMLDGTRGLNVSTAAGILLYEALRQIAGLQ